MFRSILIIAIFLQPIGANARWDDAPSPKTAAASAPASNDLVEKAKEKISAKWADMKSQMTSFFGNITKPAPAAKPAAAQPATPNRATASEMPAAGTQTPGLDPEQQAIVNENRQVKQQLQQQTTFSKTGQPLVLDRKQFAIPKGKRISRINLGTEPSISRTDFRVQLNAMLAKVRGQAGVKQKVLPADLKPLKQAQGVKIGKADIKTLDEKQWKIDKPVSRIQIEKTAPKIVADNPNVEIKPYIDFRPEDLLYLAIQIESSKKNRCHVVMGLSRELLKVKEYTDESRYHIGRCSAELALHHDKKKFLLPLIRDEQPNYMEKAIQYLVQDLHSSDYSDVAPVLVNLKNEAAIHESVRDEANYIIAKDAYENGQYQRAIQHAGKIKKASALYMEGQMLASLAQFNRGEENEAQKTMLNLRQYMTENKRSDKNVESLISLSLARFYFSGKKYEQAIKEYRAVEKNHPTWVQSMVELGWAQIAMGDYAGAIGNMYSMHSPFFETVFKPETYAVRAIGYLNICQYGDAYKAIVALEGIHVQWYQAVHTYLKNRSNPLEYYQTVRSYLQSGMSKQNTDALPYQVVREMARRRNFINVQKTLNEKVDERAELNKISSRIAQDVGAARYKRMQAQARLTQVNANLRAAKTNKALLQNVNGWEADRRNEEKLIDSYTFQSELYTRAKKSYDQLRAETMQSLASEESSLKLAAGKALKSNLQEMDGQMRQLFENNEFLRFEVFTGSGENIRYQVAGGETAKPNRIPSYVKPQKIMDWQFDGEYWADEIGSYRSSLTNNCPKFKKQIGMNNGGGE